MLSSSAKEIPLGPCAKPIFIGRKVAIRSKCVSRLQCWLGSASASHADTKVVILHVA